MTDNEKAATFIGWKPHSRVWIKERNAIHTAPPPDMSNPFQYMQALQRVAAMKLRPSLSFDEDCGQWHCDLALKVGHGCYSYYADDPEYAVMAALAALYDAQHVNATK